jgi:hypothetical protein
VAKTKRQLESEIKSLVGSSEIGRPGSDPFQLAAEHWGQRHRTRAVESRSGSRSKRRSRAASPVPSSVAIRDRPRQNADRSPDPPVLVETPEFYVPVDGYVVPGEETVLDRIFRRQRELYGERYVHRPVERPRLTAAESRAAELAEAESNRRSRERLESRRPARVPDRDPPGGSPTPTAQIVRRGVLAGAKARLGGLFRRGRAPGQDAVDRDRRRALAQVTPGTPGAVDFRAEVTEVVSLRDLVSEDQVDLFDHLVRRARETMRRGDRRTAVAELTMARRFAGR